MWEKRVFRLLLTFFLLKALEGRFRAKNQIFVIFQPGRSQSSRKSSLKISGQCSSLSYISTSSKSFKSLIRYVFPHFQIDSAMTLTSLNRVYLSNEINKFFPMNGKVTVNATLSLLENSYTKSLNVKRDVQTKLIEVIQVNQVLHLSLMVYRKKFISRVSHELLRVEIFV